MNKLSGNKRCFVITPIGSDQSAERRHANMVFEIALKPYLEKQGYNLERADFYANPDQITAAIFSALNEAELCVADLTYLNPNVMYELGIRHALQKPVIQIAGQGTVLPFDTANQRTLFFDPADVHSLYKLGDGIVAQLASIEENDGHISNPLTAALGVFANAAAADPQAQVFGQLIERVRAIEANLSGLTAAAITGQGDLATKNMRELQRVWRTDQIAQSLNWQAEVDGSEVAEYRGFSLRVIPRDKGRWSSSAVKDETGYSVPWPVWQSSRDDAKSTIVSAVDAAIAEKDN